MTDYDYLVARVGKTAADKAARLGYVEAPGDIKTVSPTLPNTAYKPVMRDSTQLALWPQDEAPRPLSSVRRKSRAGAFTDNMSLPIHRWFRYSAGFSAEWAEQVISRHCPKDGVVFDPFAGSGTTMLAARSVGRTSAGVEAHDFVRRVAQAKLAIDVDGSALISAAQEMMGQARSLTRPDVSTAPDLIGRCFESEALIDLVRLRNAWLERTPSSESVDNLLWLALTAILRPCSHVGTAQWQYVLPDRRKATVADPMSAFQTRVAMMAADLEQVGPASVRASIYAGDARVCEGIASESVDLVVTSPPYPNNYDYADATRLEMTFWGEIQSWSDLQSVVRRNLIRSCSQHSAAEKLELGSILSRPEVEPIREELAKVSHALAEVRMTKGGKKTYHTMIAAYFADMAMTLIALRRVVRSGGSCHLMIGDSAPYGVYAPCDRWLGELALAAGFRAWTFEKVRDRNLKWKNRKHEVPLKEGILTVVG